MTNFSQDDFSAANSDVADSSEQKAFFLPESISTPSDFFDRERWHDVETEDGLSPEDASAETSTFISFSLTVLLLVAVGATVGGLVAAYKMGLLDGTATEMAVEVDATPEQWIGYSMDGIVPCEVNEPNCFAAFRDGQWVIGDSRPASLLFYQNSEKPIKIVSLEKEPLSVAIGGSDTLFPENVIVAHPDRLTVYTQDGTRVVSWNLPNDKGQIRSLALTKDAIYAADSLEKVVYRFDETGKLVGEIGRVKTQASIPAAKNTMTTTEEEDVFEGLVVLPDVPISVAVSPANGMIYVSNPGKYRIEVFTPEGNWEPSLGWGHASNDLIGFAGNGNPAALAALPDGRIVTAERSIPRVKVFRKDRRLDCIVAGPEILGGKPANIPQLEMIRADNNEQSVAIAALNDGTVYIFDPFWRVVRHFVPISSFSADYKPDKIDGPSTGP